MYFKGECKVTLRLSEVSFKRTIIYSPKMREKDTT